MKTTTCLSATLVAALSLWASGCGEQTCGNGRLDRNEQCDPRAPSSFGTCTQFCTLSNLGGTGGYCINGQQALGTCTPGVQQNCLPCSGGLGTQQYCRNGIPTQCFPSATDPTCQPCAGTQQYCRNGIPTQCFPSVNDPTCQLCSGSGGQLCFRQATPGCSPNAIPGVQCTFCPPGYGPQGIPACFPPNAPGCRSEISGPQACTPCGFGGGGGIRWCNPQQGSITCIQGTPGCVQCGFAMAPETRGTCGAPSDTFALCKSALRT